MSTFTIDGDHFVLDGRPTRLLSGAIHYFRVHADCWRDRLLKLRACGLNALETYVAWNLHEPEPGAALDIAVPDAGATLDILVENMGRINYGPRLADRKGITEGVRFNNQFLFGWAIYPLPLDDLSALAYKPAADWAGPAFYRARFVVQDPRDTWLALPGWTKGVCWVNGFNLGRYWEVGPQRTLYVPAPLLKQGDNELVVFELHGMRAPVVEFRDRPDLG